MNNLLKKYMGHLFGVQGVGGGLAQNDNFYLAGNGTYLVKAGTLLQVLSVLGGGLSAIPADATAYGITDFFVPGTSARLTRYNPLTGRAITTNIPHDVTITMSKFALGGALIDPAYTVTMARGFYYVNLDPGFTYTVTGVVNTPYPGQVRTPLNQVIQIGTAPGGADILPPTNFPGGVNIDITLNKTFDGGALLYFTGITTLTDFNVIYTNNVNSNPF